MNVYLYVCMCVWLVGFGLVWFGEVWVRWLTETVVIDHRESHRMKLKRRVESESEVKGIQPTNQALSNRSTRLQSIKRRTVSDEGEPILNTNRTKWTGRRGKERRGGERKRRKASEGGSEREQDG